MSDIAIVQLDITKTSLALGYFLRNDTTKNILWRIIPGSYAAKSDLTQLRSDFDKTDPDIESLRMKFLNVPSGKTLKITSSSTFRAMLWCSGGGDSNHVLYSLYKSSNNTLGVATLGKSDTCTYRIKK